MEAWLARLPAKTLRRWERYYEVEPFGEFREDLRAASICAMIHNINVDAKHRLPVGEFLLSFEDAEDRAERERKAIESLPKINGVPITEQVWYAMCIAAMNAAGGADPMKVIIEDK